MKDDKILREELMKRIAEIKKLPRPVQREVEFAMFEDFKVEMDQTIDIFNGLIRVETMPYHMLYKLMKSIKRVSLNRTDINTTNLKEDLYFYDFEKEEFSKPLIRKDKDFDIVIKEGNWHHTVMFPYDYFTIHIDVNELEVWDKYNKLRFNPETQRDLVVITENGTPIVKLDLNEDAVNRMQNNMANKVHFPVQGAININPEHNNQTVLIKNGDLIIPKEVKMDLIEGFHNYAAAIKTKRNNKDWNFPYEFRIMFLNTELANSFISQMDQKTHLRKSQTVRMDTNNPITYIITSLNMSPRFRLKGSISNDMVVFIYDIIEKFYKFNSDNDKFTAYDIIQEYMNLIIGIKKIKNPLTKEEWFSYLYLINKYKDDWNSLEKIITKNEFDKYLIDLKVAKKPTTNQIKSLESI